MDIIMFITFAAISVGVVVMVLYAIVISVAYASIIAIIIWPFLVGIVIGVYLWISGHDNLGVIVIITGIMGNVLYFKYYLENNNNVKEEKYRYSPTSAPCPTCRQILHQGAVQCPSCMREFTGGLEVSCCSTCHGSGVLYDDTCWSCKGTGGVGY